MAKFQVMMKNPDAVGDAIDEAAREEANAIAGLDESERNDVFESRRGKIADACSKWFEYSEYLTVEVDTEAGTCVVVPCE